MDEAILRQYAELLVRTGGNVQPGQPVVLSCDVDNAFFARMVEEAAYDAGACDVAIDWMDSFSIRTRYLRAADNRFDSYPQWRVDRFKYFDDMNAVYLHARSTDPDLLNGVSPDRIKRSTKAMRMAVKPHTELTMTNARRWSLIALPSVPWAKKVFPGLPDEEAVAALWKLILKGARADGANPAQEWKSHKANFKKRIEYMNGMNFKALRFKNGLGTDFTVDLIANHIWSGGGDTGQDGVPFFPNMPTEEIFTMPAKNGANGRVVASIPLSYQGNLIENFVIDFKDGRAVDYSAEKNFDTLKSIIEMDEGSHYLGEVAIVTNSSPIAQMKTLFFETLFDENASCHLALGKAYPDTVRGGEKMSEAERAAAGVNDSLLHVDFMFGTPDMCITGIGADGSETAFFRDGEFLI